MLRDMDLVRHILIALADYPHGFAPSGFAVEGEDDERVGYHVWLMDQAGLLTAADTTSQQDDSPCAIPTALTWRGHEFLDAARNENIWNRAKQSVGKIGSASLPVWVEILSRMALQAAGITAPSG